jgi:hypothetical protein
MRNIAIAIGIDAYVLPHWRLEGAVADAVDFAKWALSDADVAPQDLTLLLSPADVHAPVPYENADLETFRQTLLAHRDGRPAADRLFFHFAGHGLSDSKTAPEPVLLLADARSEHEHVRISEVLRFFRNVEPREQFFFFDACRNFPFEERGKHVALPPLESGPPHIDQYVIYATAAGRFAQEIEGRGVFSQILLNALRGAPTALDISPPGMPREVRFSRLARHVHLSVTEAMRREGVSDDLLQQAPEWDASGRGGMDPVLVRLRLV